MKKKLFLFILCTMIGTGSVAYSFEKSDAEIEFKGWDYEYEGDIYNINDTLYVPLRETFEMFRTPVEWDEQTNTATIDISNRYVAVDPEDNGNKKGVITDEETAYAIGKILLEKYVGRELEYENDIGVFYLKVITNNPYFNTWAVYQECDFKMDIGSGGTGVASPTIVLDGNTGEVLSIYTAPHFIETEEGKKFIDEHVSKE